MSYFYVKLVSGSGYWCEGVAFVGAGAGRGGERIWCYENERQIKQAQPSFDRASGSIAAVEFCLDPTKSWMKDTGAQRTMGLVKLAPAPAPASKADDKALLAAYQKQVDDESDAIIAQMTRAHKMRVYYQLNTGHNISLNGPAGSLLGQYMRELEAQLKARKP